jgi:hypothetical protein
VAGTGSLWLVNNSSGNMTFNLLVL